MVNRHLDLTNHHPLVAEMLEKKSSAGQSVWTLAMKKKVVHSSIFMRLLASTRSGDGVKTRAHVYKQLGSN